MTSSQPQFAAIKQHIGARDYAKALAELFSSLSPADDFVVQARAARLLGSIPAGELKLKPIKIAVAASSTMDQFVELFRLWLAREGFAAEIWSAPFNTVVPTVLDAEGTLYRFKPDIVWLFGTYRDVVLEVPLGDDRAVPKAVEAAVQQRAFLWRTLQERLSCAVIENNADIPLHDDFGNFAGQAAWSLRNGLRRYNLELAAAAPAGVTIFDLDQLSAAFGKANWVDERYWFHSKNAFGFQALGAVAFQGARLVTALKTGTKKCVILDLDNTIWGGVIGDDGMNGIKLGNGAEGEAFVAIQRWAKSLKERGIILAVCSKNDPEIAKEPFLKHPDMVLRLDDIAVFRANWDNKADNIAYIVSALNIGMDSVVFVDDNPVERDLVRKYLPAVAVPELPADPAGFVAAINAQLYFETVGFSSEDRERARFYRDNAARAEKMASFADQSEYLRWLEMTAELGDLDEFNLPRIAQLVNKSNQFNLTTIRYTEAELQGLARRADTRIRHYRLLDRYGDNGLISVVILSIVPGGALGIDLWVMSCRVLARTMEEFIFNDILAIARRNGCGSITGRYIPTAKNGLVCGLYERLGFRQTHAERGTTDWTFTINEATVPAVTYVDAAAPAAKKEQ